MPDEDAESRLSLAQRQALLNIARWTLETFLDDGSEASYRLRDPELEKLAAAFVTLKYREELRGCVGYTHPLYPLHQMISRCARSAASEDHRFQPVQRGELSELRISISVLSSLERVDNLENIVVGRDGLLVVESERRGLLLPQVAPEQGWDRESFLDGVCRKAGLPDSAWRTGRVEVFAFLTDNFSEGETEVAVGLEAVTKT